MLLEDYGDVPLTSCQNVYCEASGREVCCRCADTDKPACSYCNSCSMCWLIGPHILKPGYDNYQKRLAKECDCEDCPVTGLLEEEDRCLSCFETAVRDQFGCNIWKKHETWTIPECGHLVCEALQMEMRCGSNKAECSMCKSEKEYEAKKKEQETEAAKEQSDVAIMKDCMEKVSSQSARSVLEKWLKDHASNKKPRTSK